MNVFSNLMNFSQNSWTFLKFVELFFFQICELFFKFDELFFSNLTDLFQNRRTFLVFWWTFFWEIDEHFLNLINWFPISMNFVNFDEILKKLMNYFSDLMNFFFKIVQLFQFSIYFVWKLVKVFSSLMNFFFKIDELFLKCINAWAGPTVARLERYGPLVGPRPKNFFSIFFFLFVFT